MSPQSKDRSFEILDSHILHIVSTTNSNLATHVHVPPPMRIEFEYSHLSPLVIHPSDLVIILAMQLNANWKIIDARMQP